MQTIQRKNLHIWFDPNFITKADNQHFDPDYWLNQDKIIGSAQGRGTTYFVQLESIQGALRHYRRGGLFGKMVNDRYLFCGWENTRSYQEFDLLLHLKQHKVNVPNPIAARAVKKGVSYQADLLSEKVPNAQDLVDILLSSSLDARTYRSIGLEIAKMHRAGVNHTDLNIHNILLDKQNTVWLIDFDKCSKAATATDKQANLDRLLRSFNKEKQKRTIHWEVSEWQYLMNGYHSID